jgi:glycosyltransferase involved in cell wall biosynthesis
MRKISVIFLAYNQAQYVVAALRSALDQDYPEIEFVISDDCSTDETRSLIEAELRLHSRVASCRLLPEEANRGIVRSWDRAVAASTGEILVGFAGDDISDPSRVSTTVAMFQRDSRVYAVFCQARIIGKSGEVIRQAFLQGRPEVMVYSRSASDTFYEFWCGAPVLGATGAYRRELALVFGEIPRGSSEDDPYVYRALLLGAVAYSPQVLVSWRWHGNNASLGALQEAQDKLRVLEVRSAIYLRRRRGALQLVRDLGIIYRLGYISEARYRHERRLLGAMRAAEALRYDAISPAASLAAVIQSGCKFLAWSGWSLRSIVSVLSSIKTRLSSTQRKLKKSRPL